jgi:hypothetical protein
MKIIDVNLPVALPAYLGLVCLCVGGALVAGLGGSLICVGIWLTAAAAYEGITG